MADTSTVSKYPKAENDESDVKAVQQNRLGNGAKSCVLTEDATYWILTTVWAGNC